jgi:hypothetical protein
MQHRSSQLLPSPLLDAWHACIARAAVSLHINASSCKSTAAFIDNRHVHDLRLCVVQSNPVRYRSLASAMESRLGRPLGMTLALAL